MTLRKTIPDILRRFRFPASGPTEYYQVYNNFNRAVGIQLLSLYPAQQRTPASLVFIQSDNANLGFVSVGGQNTNIANGAQLAPGMAVVFTAEGGQMDVARMLAGQLGASALAQVDYTGLGFTSDVFLESLGGVFNPNGPRIVIDVAQFFAVATLAAQNVRIVYTQLIRI